MLQEKMQKRIQKLSARFNHVQIDLGPIDDPVFDAQTNALLAQLGAGAVQPDQVVEEAKTDVDLKNPEENKKKDDAPKANKPSEPEE